MARCVLFILCRGGRTVKQFAWMSLGLVVLVGSGRADGLSDASQCASTGNPDLVIQYCTRAINSGMLSSTNLAITLRSRGNAYSRKDRYDRAIKDYDQALVFNPRYTEASYNQGNVYGHKGQYDQTLLLRPDLAETRNYKALALNGKAWNLATARNANDRDGWEAVRLAKEALKLLDYPALCDTLAAAYAEAGLFNEAVREQERAISMLQAKGKHDKVADFQSHLNHYRRSQPYREK